MSKLFISAAAALAVNALAHAQGSASVDLLNPNETSGTIPANTRAVDIFFDCTITDVWTAAGIRAVAEHGAVLSYFDADLNTPGLQPGLFSGGIANKFTTMLSKPRARDGAARFTNAMAAPAGAYDPPAVSPVTLPTELNVAYFASPPETPTSPAFDGYIARIAIDVSGVQELTGFPKSDYNNWGAGPIENIPSSSLVVLRSVPVNQQGGTATATFDVPQLNFTSWAVWYMPEPASWVLLLLAGAAARLRR